jgi:hypothetical protein
VRYHHHHIQIEGDICHWIQPIVGGCQGCCVEEMKVLQEEIDAMKDKHSNGAVHIMFPFGPTCTFNGVEVPTFVTCSKNYSNHSPFDM